MSFFAFAERHGELVEPMERIKINYSWQSHFDKLRVTVSLLRQHKAERFLNILFFAYFQNLHIY